MATVMSDTAHARRLAGEQRESSGPLPRDGGQHSLYDLIRPCQQRWWDRQAERPCRLEIDDQLVLGSLLHREVGRLGPLEDLVDVSGCAPERVVRIREVTHETACLHIVLRPKHSSQTVLQREFDNQGALSAKERRWHGEKAAHTSSGHHRERPIEILACSHWDRQDLKPESLGGGLGGLQGGAGRGCRRHCQHTDPAHVEQHLRHYLELLGHDLGHEHRHTGDVAPRPRKARHVADAYRIGVITEYDGNGLGHLSDGPVEVGAKIRSTFRRTSSAAISGSRSTVSAHRKTRSRFLPSTYPRSSRPALSALNRLPDSPGEP